MKFGYLVLLCSVFAKSADEADGVEKAWSTATEWVQFEQKESRASVAKLVAALQAQYSSETQVSGPHTPRLRSIFTPRQHVIIGHGSDSRYCQRIFFWG